MSIDSERSFELLVATIVSGIYAATGIDIMDAPRKRDEIVLDRAIEIAKGVRTRIHKEGAPL